MTFQKNSRPTRSHLNRNPSLLEIPKQDSVYREAKRSPKATGNEQSGVTHPRAVTPNSQISKNSHASNYRRNDSCHESICHFLLPNLSAASQKYREATSIFNIIRNAR